MDYQLGKIHLKIKDINIYYQFLISIFLEILLLISFFVIIIIFLNPLEKINEKINFNLWGHRLFRISLS